MRKSIVEEKVTKDDVVASYAPTSASLACAQGKFKGTPSAPLGAFTRPSKTKKIKGREAFSHHGVLQLGKPAV